MVGAVTVAGVLLGRRLTRAVPATILGLIAGVIAYFGMGLIWPELLHLDHNKLVIGPVGGGLGAVVASFGSTPIDARPATGRPTQGRGTLAPA